MKALIAGFPAGLAAFGEVLKGLLRLLPILLDLIRNLVRAICHPRKPRDREGCCVAVPPSVHVRADPLLYSQEYLMKQGLAVTWDNPDIQLFKAGAPVSSGDLEPGVEYEVQVRVWNNSTDAPAPGLPVRLSFLSFGAGATSTPLGTQQIQLGVKGSPHCPAFAKFPWRTPSEGHYCLQARLDWSDDANPDNNMGQENTQVRKPASPATFEFDLRNAASTRRQFAFKLDGYALPRRDPCGDSPREPPGSTRLAVSRRRWERARVEHAAQKHPVPTGWTVTLSPDRPELAPGETQKIKVVVEPPATGFTGRVPVNVNAFALDGEQQVFAGGVTLYVER